MRIITILTLALAVRVRAQLDMNSDRMDFEDNIAEESHSDEQVYAQALASKPIFNNGKPFYVGRDPATGTLDFNVKKTVGISNDIPVNKKDELSGGSKGHDINSLGQNNFHDYLNLPVKYSSSKFVYPLISGSYANLKYQGNNKNHTSNHKNYTTTVGTTTQSPKYFTSFIHPTQTHPQRAPETTKTDFTRDFTITKAIVEKITTPEVKTTTQRLTTTERTTTSQKKTSTTVSSTEKVTKTSPDPTTVKFSSTIVQNSFPSTFKNKYVDSSETRKKTTLATTTSRLPETSTPPAHPVKFIDDLTASETRPTTYRPPFDVTKLSFSTSMPLLPSAFKPMPKDSPKNQSKISFESNVNNPSIMTLSEIINSFSNKDEEENSIQYEVADSSPTEVKKLPSSTHPPQTKHQTLQQQLQNQQQSQFVDSQPQFAPPVSHVGFPNDQFEDYVEFENPEDERYASQYVKYEVQKPNVNLVKFQQAPSMNNVVISPGQNSASFVLGSQQNVGNVGVGSSMGVGTSEFENNGPMKVGQVINEELPVRTAQNQSPAPIQTNIRFPNDSEQQHFDNAPIVKGVIKLDGTSESVQPPQALSQNQPLVFPIGNKQKVETQPATPNPSQIIFENVNDIYGKINDKKQRQEVSLNEVSNNIAPGELTPPQVLTPPSLPQRPGQQQYPQQQQQFVIRRPGGPSRPGLLPNILPQFRPNAKASQGHPHQYKDVGAIRLPHQGPAQGFHQGHPPSVQYHQHGVPISLPKVGLPSNSNAPPPNYRRVVSNRPPQFRKGPIPPPQNAAFDPNLENANRRVFRLPPPPSPDRTFMRPPQIAHPGFKLKRPLNGPPETMQMQQRISNVPPHLQESELNKSAPPAMANLPKKEIEGENSIKLEPVVTLQMLQNKKNGNKLNLPPVPHDIPQDIQASFPQNHQNGPPKDPSVYVVYPVASSSFENAAQPTFEAPSTTFGEETRPGMSEYQNTPFSVVSHFEQEPLLMKKDKKKKNPFPYLLERPVPPAEFQFERPIYGPSHEASLYNMGETPSSPRVVNKPSPFAEEHPEAQISSKLTRVTEKPIAIAYTPTEPNSHIPTVTNFYNNLHPHHHYEFDEHHFSLPNYGGPVISEILDEKRFDYYHQQQALQQHLLNNGEDLDFYKDHYEFQAPFHASVSLPPEVTNPYEGWSIVTQSTDTNKIDRADSHVSESSEELTTRKFDPNQFKPVFESGFQPLAGSFPSKEYEGKKASTAPELTTDSSEVPTTFSILYSTQPITTSTTQSPTSEKPPEHQDSTTKKAEKKKVEIDSLEAFFESLTRDYEEDESTNVSASESSSRSL